MKSRGIRRIVVFSFFIVSLLVPSFSVFAKYDGFVATEQVQDIDTIFARLELESIVEPNVKKSFSCFDVNKQGEYVLGFNGHNKDYLLAYSPTGEFLFGYSFIDNGKFGILWEDENINLFSSRSNLIVTVDNNGNCLGIKQITDQAENHAYWRKEVFANNRRIDDTTYTAKHWLYNHELLHWGAYQELIRNTPSGENIVLFNNTNCIRTVIFAFTVGVTILAFIVTVAIVRKRHDQRENH